MRLCDGAKKAVGSLLVILALGAASGCPQAIAGASEPTEKSALVEGALTEAKRLYHLHHYDEAIAVLEEALNKQPRQYDLLLAYGRMLMKQGRYQKAVDTFLQCQMVKPADNESRFLAAEAYVSMARLKDAELVARQVLQRSGPVQDKRRAGSLLSQIASYRAMGDLAAPHYVPGDLQDYMRFKRADFPLKVAIWVEPALRQYRGVFEKAVRSSFQRWCDASGGYLRFEVVPEQRNARIVCKLLRTVRNGGGHFGRKLGETMLDDNEGLEDGLKFSRVEVFFNLEQDPREIPAITLHEVGHALGLEHSGNPKDIMFPHSREPYADILSARDKNSIRRLYGITADMTASP